MRYTAEHRGGDWGDKPWEWCVVDEEVGICGSAVAFDMTKEQAVADANMRNLKEKGKTT